MGANPHRHERCVMRIHLPHRYALVLCGGRGTAADQVACTGMVVSTEGHNRDGTPSDDPITHPSHAHSQPAEAHTHGVPCETEHLSTPLQSQVSLQGTQQPQKRPLDQGLQTSCDN